MLLLLWGLLLGGCGAEQVMGAYLSANQDEIAQPYSVDTRPVRFEVAPGTTAQAIAQQLQEANLIGDARLFQLFRYQLCSERRGIKGYSKVGCEIGNGADMVLMPMGDDNAPNQIEMIHQVVEIRDDVIDPQHIIFREHDAGINNEDILAVFVKHHIFSNFPQTTQGNDAKFF